MAALALNDSELGEGNAKRNIVVSRSNREVTAPKTDEEKEVRRSWDGQPPRPNS